MAELTAGRIMDGATADPDHEAAVAKTAPNDSFPLFGRLPEELRSEIWKHAFAGPVVYMPYEWNEYDPHAPGGERVRGKHTGLRLTSHVDAVASSCNEAGRVLARVHRVWPDLQFDVSTHGYGTHVLLLKTVKFPSPDFGVQIFYMGPDHLWNMTHEHNPSFYRFNANIHTPVSEYYFKLDAGAPTGFPLKPGQYLSPGSKALFNKYPHVIQHIALQAGPSNKACLGKACNDLCKRHSSLKSIILAFRLNKGNRLGGRVGHKHNQNWHVTAAALEGSCATEYFTATETEKSFPLDIPELKWANQLWFGSSEEAKRKVTFLQFGLEVMDDQGRGTGKALRRIPPAGIIKD